MMQLRRADYLLDYQDPAENAFKASHLPPLPHVTLLQQDFTIAYSLVSPRAKQLRDELDRAIEALQAQDALPSQYRQIFPYASETANPL